jgi:hypothetical protein
LQGQTPEVQVKPNEFATVKRMFKPCRRKRQTQRLVIRVEPRGFYTEVKISDPGERLLMKTNSAYRRKFYALPYRTGQCTLQVFLVSHSEGELYSTRDKAT